MRRILAVMVLGLAAFGCSESDGGGEGGAGGVGGEGGVGPGGAGGAPEGGAGGAPVGGQGGQGGMPMGGEGGEGGGTFADVVIEPGPAEAARPDAVNADLGIDTTRGECPAEFGWVSAVRGWIIDEAGNAIGGAKAQACVYTEPGNVLQCLNPVDSDPAGVFTIEIGENFSCMSHAVMRVILPGGGRAAMYCEVPVDEPEVRIQDPIVLFSTTAASAVGDPDDWSLARDIVFPDGTTLYNFVPDNYFGTDFTALGMQRVAPDAIGTCFLGDSAATAVTALYPEGELTTDLDFRVPNDLGLAAGSKVTFSVLGSLECLLDSGEKIEEAEWGDFGTGTVSADGMWVENDAGSGLPCISWIGYRAQ